MEAARPPTIRRPRRRLPARRRGRRRARRADRVRHARRDPRAVRPGRPHRLRAVLRAHRRDHRRHPDDAVHRRGAAPRRGPFARTAGIVNVPWIVSRAYLRWLVTQGGPDLPDPELGSCDTGWLITHRHLHSPRGAGQHLPVARCAPAAGDHRRAHQRQQGLRRRDARRAGRHRHSTGPRRSRSVPTAAAITHGHPTGYLRRGRARDDRRRAGARRGAARRGRRWRAPSWSRTRTTTRPATRSTPPSTSRPAACPRPSSSSRSAAAGSPRRPSPSGSAARSSPTDVRHGLLLAVNHSGDADSTGAIAGNLLGAAHGVGAIPADLLDPLEFRDLIEQHRPRPRRRLRRRPAGPLRPLPAELN